jgi:hypothetical protein
MIEKNNSRYIILVLAAVMVGLACVYPDIFFIHKAGPEYKGIAPIGFTDEIMYLARLNAVYKGDAFSGNPAIYEHRKDPVVIPPVPELIEASFGKLFGLDTPSLDIAATFLLPSILFILIFLFASELSGSFYGGLLSGLGFILGRHLFSGPFLYSGRLINSSYNLPMWFSRPISPQMNFVLFTSAILLVFKSMVSDKKTFMFLGGFFLGLLFYTSVFYWVFIYSSMALYAVFLMIRKDASSAKRLFWIAVIGLAVSIPYWLGNIRLMAYKDFGILFLRLNAAFTHKPILPMPNTLLLLLMLLANKLLISDYGKKAYYFMLSMLMAVILTMNQQIFTGKLFMESHWNTYTGKFVFIVLGILFVCSLSKRAFSSRWASIWIKSPASFLFVIILFCHAFGLQVNYSDKYFSSNLDMQKKAQLLSWIRTNLSHDDVVLPSPNDTRLSELIPIYTKSFVYYSEAFFIPALVSFDEARYRTLTSYRLFGFTPEDVLKHPYSLEGAVFIMNDSCRENGFKDKKKAEMARIYKDMLSEEGLVLVKKYKVDYVVTLKDKDDDAAKGLILSGGKMVYEDPYFSVIRL